MASAPGSQTVCLCGDPMKPKKKYCGKHHRAYESIFRKTFPVKKKGKAKKKKKGAKGKKKANNPQSGATAHIPFMITFRFV